MGSLSAELSAGELLRGFAQSYRGTAAGDPVTGAVFVHRPVGECVPELHSISGHDDLAAQAGVLLSSSGQLDSSAICAGGRSQVRDAAVVSDKD